MAKDVRVNNKEVVKKLNEWMKALDRNISIKIGIIGEQAYQKHGESGLTNAELGAVHEFGATINHSGGTPYFIKEDGMAQFVSKDKGAKLPKTKPHTINIPARAWLRKPLLSTKGKRELLKAVQSELGSEFEVSELSEITANKLVDNAVHFLAETSLVKVQQAFTNDEILPHTKNSSKKQRKYDPNAPTLMDTGQLYKSITYEIKETK